MVISTQRTVLGKSDSFVVGIPAEHLEKMRGIVILELDFFCSGRINPRRTF